MDGDNSQIEYFIIYHRLYGCFIVSEFFIFMYIEWGVKNCSHKQILL